MASEPVETQPRQVAGDQGRRDDPGRHAQRRQREPRRGRDRTAEGDENTERHHECSTDQDQHGHRGAVGDRGDGAVAVHSELEDDEVGECAFPGEVVDGDQAERHREGHHRADAELQPKGQWMHQLHGQVVDRQSVDEPWAVLRIQRDSQHGQRGVGLLVPREDLGPQRPECAPQPEEPEEGAEAVLDLPGPWTVEAAVATCISTTRSMAAPLTVSIQATREAAGMGGVPWRVEDRDQ